MDTQNISIPENLENNNVSSGEELIPAEVAARQEREGAFAPQPDTTADESIDTTAGYTVSGQGLVNNYAVTPQVYEEQESLAEKRRDYTMLGVVGLAIATLLVGAAIAVNLAA
ncbi:hypothetical protein FLX56_24560 [Synechococcus moorigangaii CMS01]|nr:hypothetical protein [Synechococcus moorigangaii CMS01]